MHNSETGEIIDIKTSREDQTYYIFDGNHSNNLVKVDFKDVSQMNFYNEDLYKEDKKVDFVLHAHIMGVLT